MLLEFGWAAANLAFFIERFAIHHPVIVLQGLLCFESFVALVAGIACVVAQAFALLEVVPARIF